MSLIEWKWVWIILIGRLIFSFKSNTLIVLSREHENNNYLCSWIWSLFMHSEWGFIFRMILLFSLLIKVIFPLSSPEMIWFFLLFITILKDFTFDYNFISLNGFS
jgi:hypothetical protein